MDRGLPWSMPLSTGKGCDLYPLNASIVVLSSFMRVIQSVISEGISRFLISWISTGMAVFGNAPEILRKSPETTFPSSDTTYQDDGFATFELVSSLTKINRLYAGINLVFGFSHRTNHFC